MLSFCQLHFNRSGRSAIISVGLLLVLLFSSRPVLAENWALLIGIDNYKDANNINGLGGAVADATALKRTLIRSLGFKDDPEHIRLLLNGQATRSDILAALTRLKASVREGDLVFIFYAGHGIEVSGTPYLLPFETNAISEEDLTDSALPIAKFQERLRVIKAKMLLLCFDMCRRDPLKLKRDAVAANELNQGTVRGLDFQDVVGKGNGPALVVTLYSCSPNERAYEDTLRSRGFFSWFLEQGLEGAAAGQNGLVTVGSLTDYLDREVPTAVARAQNGKRQTPYPIPAGPGATQFVLARTQVIASSTATTVTEIDLEGRLIVATGIPTALVRVNGQEVKGGVYSMPLIDAASQQVQIIVTASGYKPRGQSVTLIRGETVKVTMPLEKLGLMTMPPTARPKLPEKQKAVVVKPTSVTLENAKAINSNQRLLKPLIERADRIYPVALAEDPVVKYYYYRMQCALGVAVYDGALTSSVTLQQKVRVYHRPKRDLADSAFRRALSTGNESALIAIVNDETEPYCRSFLYSVIALERGKRGDKNATKWLDRAITSAKAIVDDIAYTSALATGAYVAVQLGNGSRALDIINGVRSVSFKAMVLCDVVVAVIDPAFSLE